MNEKNDVDCLNLKAGDLLIVSEDSRKESREWLKEELTSSLSEIGLSSVRVLVLPEMCGLSKFTIVRDKPLEHDANTEKDELRKKLSELIGEDIPENLKVKWELAPEDIKITSLDCEEQLITMLRDQVRKAKEGASDG
jgi:hypothetical protein